MKRGREESSTGPQLKRPSSTRGDSIGLSQPSGGVQKLTTDDALAYLKAVKEMFKDKKANYDEFLEVMKDFKSQRIDTAGVISRVKDLFKGHRDLILGFNTFLPKGYEITLPPEEEPAPKKLVEFDQAINYVNKIKTRFQNDEQVYKAFLEILNMYRKGSKSISEVYQEVAMLFHNHHDLLEEFGYFLPDSTGPSSVSHPSISARTSTGPVVRGDEKGSVMISVRHPHGEKVVKREKTVIAKGDNEQRLERHLEKSSMKVENEQRKKAEKEKEKKGDREQKEREGDEKTVKHDRIRDPDRRQRLLLKSKSARKSDDVLLKQTHSGEGGETFGGQSVPTSSIEDKKVLKNVYLHEFQFFEKVKAKLRNYDRYQDFLKCLHIYSQEIINRTELQSLVADIIGKHLDLMDGFNDFLSRCENIDDVLAGVFNKSSLTKTIKMEDRGRVRDPDKEKHCKKDRDSERDKERERDKIASHVTKDSSSQKVSLLPIKEKYMSKPISEWDLSSCERCTPSYRLLPKNYPKPIVSHRTDLAKAVLNDNWVSVTSGSEDYSFKHMRKNQYEESLFRCEDDRFELDMLLECTAVTIKRVEELLEKMQNGSIKQEGEIQIEDNLTDINVHCIERIYSDHGLDVIDLVRKNASVALPVILSRLKQKKEEWLRCRADMNKVWAEVYAKNYQKSLDHRSFYFKQQDKKSLSTKDLLGEIKEINEKKRKEDDVLIAIASGNRRPLIADLKFEYPDPAINEDLYQIIKYSCDELCTTMEQSDKIMKIWTTFMEPMLGVPPRPHGTEDTEEVVKVKTPELKGSEASLGDSDGSTGAATNMKQLTPIGSKDNITVETLTSDKTRIINDETLVGEDNICGTDKNGCKGEDLVENSKLEKIKSSFSAANEFADVVRQGGLIERVDYTDAMHAIRTDAMHGRAGLDDVTEISRVPSKPAHLPGNNRLEIGPNDQGPLLAEESMRRSVAFRESQKTCSESDALNLGWEEENWSPIPEAEDQQNVGRGTCGNLVPGTGNVPTKKDDIANQQYIAKQEDDDCDGEAGDHDVDADDEGEESGQKSTDDSGNVSEGGEDVSESDSGDGDECSHENHEEDEEHESNDGKAESEGEAEGMADAHDAEGEGTSLLFLDQALLMAKPLAEHGPSIALSNRQEKDSMVFCGNDSLYVLFRLHQTLYERILSAKKNALTAEQKWKRGKDSSPDLYAKFMRALYSLLDGSTDNAKFEDECRSIIGTQSYVLFTLDKLIFKLVKQLQAIASDEMADKLFQLHLYERSRAPGRLIDLVYHANACILLHEENIYRFECTSNPTQLSIQLMEGGPEKLEVNANSIEPSFASYLNKEFLSADPAMMEIRHVFLARNKRKYASDDEFSTCKTMKGVQVVNGLEYKISCSTSKVSYVLDTEDILLRRKQKKSSVAAERSSENHDDKSHGFHDKRVSRFHRLVEE